MQNSPDSKSTKDKFVNKVPSFTKPVWGNLPMSCEECKYSEQDIDTFPCAKCHTRH